MTTFVNHNQELTVKNSSIECKLVSGKIYDLYYNMRCDYSYLKENGELNMPKKVYETDEDNKFIERVLTYFNSEKASQTTGVLLSGDKGTGKTVCSKRLALESNLPIIVVDTEYPVWKLNEFFKKIEDPVCMIFDELEKNDRFWATSHLLSFLDGVQATAKKLVLMTVNNIKELNDNLFDRCSRIRYRRDYLANANDVYLTDIAKDKGVKNVEEVVNFIKDRIKFRSFDNVSSFLTEVLIFEDVYTLDEILNYMNLSTNKKIENKDLDDSNESDRSEMLSVMEQQIHKQLKAYNSSDEDVINLF